MSLPPLTAPISLGASSTTYVTVSSKTRYAGASRLTPLAQVAYQVSQAQRNLAQDFIRNNCHNLRPCDDSMGADARAARLQLANRCVAARFTVRTYYIERDIDDPGNHDEAIQRNDDVVASCQ